MRRLRSTVLAAALVLAVLQPVAAARAVDADAAGFRQSRRPGISANQVVVRVDSASVLNDLKGEVERTGGRIIRHSIDGEGVLVEVPPGRDSAGYSASIAEKVPVLVAEPLVFVEATAVPTDPGYSNQWGLPAVGAPAAWDHTWGSEAVAIAVIDSGVDLDHPDLVNRIEPDGWDFVDDDASPEDMQGHGTVVAGIAAAQRNNGVAGVGIAPDCRILPLRVLDAAGQGNSLDVADAIRYAVDHGAMVINMSLGGAEYSAETDLAVQYALANDVVVVAASGNSYPTTTDVLYPARLPGVIAVGSVNSALELAPDSGRGPNLDLVAPGVGIYSTALGGGVASWTGTSMAAPFVAGTAALMRAANPAVSDDVIAAALTATARDLGAAGRDDAYGHGLVASAGAIRQVTPNPVFRFYNFTNNTHFYTASIAEADHVIATWPNVFSFEGIAYYTNPVTNTQPLYRFYNRRSRSHFYTASPSEVSKVLATWPDVFAYEGETYKVSPVQVAGSTTVYRFFNKSNGSHFYTASADEVNHVIATWPHIYQYEGPAFWLGQ